MPWSTLTWLRACDSPIFIVFILIFCRRCALSVCVLLFVLLTSVVALAESIAITSSDDVAQIVDRAPPGTVFEFAPGTYRTQTIVPKHHQTFRCDPKTIFNGSSLLTEPWQQDGNQWVYKGVPEALADRHGDMSKPRQINQIREDLYIDDVPVLRVNSLDSLHDRTVTFDGVVIFKGTFFQEGRRLYLSFDPSQQKVEYSGRVDFGMRAEPDSGDFVRVENCVFEKFATKAQLGAIQAGFTQGWTLSNVTSRLNHGAGLRIGAKTTVEGGHYVHNGQLGIAGSSGSSADNGRDTLSGDLTVIGAEIAWNNWAGYWVAWEAGGIKILKSRHVTIRNNHVHHNFGKGIWLDWYVQNFKVLGNRVHDNASIGISIEVSFGGGVTGEDRGIISQNVVERNAVPLDGDLDLNIDNSWWWGANILVQNSQRIDVTDNELLVDNGQGIGVIDANDRGHSDAADGVHRRSRDNRVYRNVIKFTQRKRSEWFDGKTGVDSDDAAKASGFNAVSADAQNRLYENTFIFPDPSWPHWRYDGQAYTYDKIPEPWETDSEFQVSE